MSDENTPFSAMRFVPHGDGAEIARLQERARTMEATVGEFRSDLKEIKVAMHLILAHHIKFEKTRGGWQFFIGPSGMILSAAIGAVLMYVFALHRGV